MNIALFLWIAKVSDIIFSQPNTYILMEHCLELFATESRYAFTMSYAIRKLTIKSYKVATKL